MANLPGRAGRYVKQSTGYSAYIPAPLPPKPQVDYDNDLQTLLSNADRALGRLDGVTSVLPNPNLFVAMFVRHESVLSSQIEGTQSTLEDILEFEAKSEHAPVKDVEEVVNYVKAMNHGLARLPQLPLSLRLIREIHQKLMEGVRGGEKTPGEFRRSQNWIGGQGGTLKTATFIPPPPQEVMPALDNLEKFLHSKNMPALVHVGIAHAQFETIHPFLDGNGRVGRLLITLSLCEARILAKPLLYLSYFLKLNRTEYYDRLTAVRSKGDWEGWLKFFLKGIADVSEYSTETARSILAMREKHRADFANNANALRLIDHLFAKPLITIGDATAVLDVSFPTAAKVVEGLASKGILRETTGHLRNKRYRYQPYIDLFAEQEQQAEHENEWPQAISSGDRGTATAQSQQATEAAPSASDDTGELGSAQTWGPKSDA